MKQLLLSCFVLFVFIGCQKDQLCTDGMIHWGGEPAADGLGWYFTSEELPKAVKLKDIPAGFLTDSLAVSVCVIKTNEKYQCFCAEPMEIYAIKKSGSVSYNNCIPDRNTDFTSCVLVNTTTSAI